MVVRNLDKYLFNGTRVIYHRRVAKCLEMEIASGSFKGKVSYAYLQSSYADVLTLHLDCLHPTHYFPKPDANTTIHNKKGAVSFSTVPGHVSGQMPFIAASMPDNFSGLFISHRAKHWMP